MLGITGLTPDIFLVFAIIAVAIFLFVSEIVRVDVAALLILVLLGLTKLVPSDQLFLGFSSDAVFALIGIMIIGRGLEVSGVVAKLSNLILRLGKDKEHRVRLLLMLIGGGLAGILRSVGTVALMLPIILRIRRITGIPRPKLLLPLSFCAILGSTLTMVGTGPLILLNSLLANSGGLADANGVATAPLGLFLVFPIGLSLLLLGVVYFSLFSRWLLPPATKHHKITGESTEYFKLTYGIGDKFCEIRVPSTSPLCDNLLNQWEPLLPKGAQVIAVKSKNTLQMPPLRNMMITQSCILAILGPEQELEQFAKKYSLKFSPNLATFAETLNPATAGLCEAVVPPSSNLVGTDFHKIHMRRQYGIQVLAVHRGNKVSHAGELGEVSLKAGDTLGMFCQWEALQNLDKSPDFVVVTTDYPKEKLNYEKIGVALLFFAIAILLVVLQLVSVGIGMLVGAVGMIFSGVLNIEEAYSAVSWRTVFLLAGLIPLGLAIQTSGASDWLANGFLTAFPKLPEPVMLLALGLIASICSLFMTNVGATVIFVPIAVNLAMIVGNDPRAFALMVAICASDSFILPTHQANALISGPGKYKVIDFIRAGAVLSLLYIIVVMLGVLALF